MKINKKTENQLVRQSNKLLEAPLFKSTVQIKLFCKIIISISESPDEDVYWFSIKQLLDEINSNEKNYKALKEIAESMKKTEDINILLDDGEVLATLFPNIFIKKAGLIGFQVNNLLKPFIIELSNGNYTQFYFKNIARLKSSYSIRIYELLKQYEKIKSRKISLNELRYFLMIESDKYHQYGHFKSKVILVAQKEIEEKTDIYFEFEEIKQGKKVEKINFLIFKNNKNYENLPISEDIKKLDADKKSDLEGLAIFKTLVDEYKISKKIALKIVETVSEEKIIRNIEYTKQEYKSGNVSKNLTGYLVDAIKNDYANTVSLFEIDNKKKEDQVIKERKLEERREELRSKFSLEFGRSEKEKFLNSLSDAEKEELKNQILEEVQLDSMSVSLLKKKGLSSPIAGMWIIKKIPQFELRRDQYIKQKLTEAGF
ncbi:hypothetical protein CEK71_18140 [Methylovulum psychrotolerans]|uniref:Initiator Rep protein WH1 domain-containing protein n=2 Tax=Methylovulum psychrotolerans TaxID=1704499 RepID=A0A1Z4C2T2_9GAMM|nr:hypothetical protein CEK71_18140 [Methylovulum psychrotolerans]